MALARLAGTAVLSAVIYALAFSRPYNLAALQGQPHYTLSQHSQADPYAFASLVAAFVALGLLYWLGWRTARQAGGWAAWAIVAGGGVASAAVLLAMFPFGADDVFADIMYGRIMSRYGGNPYVDLGAAYGADPFLPYMSWADTPAHYGPLCLRMFALAARLAGDGLVANVLAFKLLNLLFLAGSVAVVAATLRQMAPPWALAGALALAWNPLVLYETVGNGHNDIIMAFWVLAGTWAMARRRYTLGVLALAAGALVKIVPALLLPAAAMVALRGMNAWRPRLRFAACSGAAALALAGLAYLPLWRGLQTLTFLQRKAMFTTSLVAALHAWLGPHWGMERVGAALGLAAWVAVAAFALWQAWRAQRDRSWLAFPHAAYNILLFYLLAACGWYKEWYAVWPIALAAVIPSGQALATAVLLGYAGLAQPLVLWPLWYQDGVASDTARELRLGPAVMALPLAYLAARWLREHVRAAEPAEDGQSPR